jgi:hypothetical protein
MGSASSFNSLTAFFIPVSNHQAGFRSRQTFSGPVDGDRITLPVVALS